MTKWGTDVLLRTGSPEDDAGQWGDSGLLRGTEGTGGGKEESHEGYQTEIKNTHNCPMNRDRNTREPVVRPHTTDS